MHARIAVWSRVVGESALFLGIITGLLLERIDPWMLYRSYFAATASIYLACCIYLANVEAEQAIGPLFPAGSLAEAVCIWFCWCAAPLAATRTNRVRISTLAGLNVLRVSLDSIRMPANQAEEWDPTSPLQDGQAAPGYIHPSRVTPMVVRDGVLMPDLDAMLAAVEQMERPADAQSYSISYTGGSTVLSTEDASEHGVHLAPRVAEWSAAEDAPVVIGHRVGAAVHPHAD